MAGKLGTESHSGATGRAAFDRDALARLGALLCEAGTKGAAAAAGISVRSLHRRLEAEGATARPLSRRFRRDRALQLLAAGLRVAEAARALGFSGSDTFARFCRREFGRTARELRAELGAEGSGTGGAAAPSAEAPRP